MSDQSGVVNPLDVNEFFADLDKLRVPEKVDYSELRLLKLWMNSPDNVGKIIFIPFNSKHDNKGLHNLEGVRKIKLWDDAADGFITYRILPREFYGTLSSEQEALYNEVISLFDSIQAKELMNYKDLGKQTIGLIYGYILRHYDPKDAIIVDDKKQPLHDGKCALLIFPSARFATALKDNVNQKTVERNHDRNWVMNIYNNGTTGRRGYVSVIFTEATDGFGYKSVVTHDFSHEMNPVIPENLVIPEKEVEKFGNIIMDFLGRQAGKDHPFNDEVFNALKVKMTNILLKASASASAGEPKKEPQVNQNKPLDQMASAAPQQAATAPTSTTEAPKQDAAPVQEVINGAVDPLKTAEGVQTNTPPPSAAGSSNIPF